MSLLDWLRRRKTPSIPEALWQATLADLPFLAVLSPDEKARLRALVGDFLGEKEFSSAGGLELTDAMCLTIAAQGCLPILELGLSAYRGWVGIVVYPDEFVVNRQIEDDSGVVHEFDDVLSGEAWEGGPLLLSWRDALMAGEGYNVVIHEFAHKLDMRNGEADGIPALHSGITQATWEGIFFPAWERFCAQVEAEQTSAIDPYASQDPAEFFAVLTEVFFETPAELAQEFPEVYDLFRRYYRQDPQPRFAALHASEATRPHR